MKKTTMSVVVLALALMLSDTGGFAQIRRGNTEQNTTTTTTTTTSRRNSSVGTQTAEPASQTRTGNEMTTKQDNATRQQSTTNATTTRQTSQPTAATQNQGGRRNSTTATQQPATNMPAQTQPAAAQPSSAQQTAKQPVTRSSQPSNTSRPAKPVQSTPQPARNSNTTTMHPGGSTTHQNSNGAATRPSGQDPRNPMIKSPIKGHTPESIGAKPPKEPYYIKNKNRYKEPVTFNKSGYHMFGKKYKAVPKKHTITVYNDVKYYISGGIFYRYSGIGGSYIISRPPKGYSFDIYSSNTCLPPVLIDPYRDQATRIADAIAIADMFARQHPSYRRYDDAFFLNNVLNQNKYLYLFEDGVYFTFDRGICTVCDAPLGAMTPVLPYDYTEIMLGGSLFYLVDNIIFGVVCPEGTPYFEVFSIL